MQCLYGWYFHIQVFFILTVIVYLDTIGCMIAKMLSVTVYLDTIGCVMAKMLCVYERVEQKVIPFDRCYRFT